MKSKSNTETTAGLHKHKCPSCGYIWQHEDSCINNTPEHTCRKCQTEVWYWYEGDMPAVETHLCGTPLKPATQQIDIRDALAKLIELTNIG
jgi:predicted RNA-binding Zn-ribbon protein involved in translation (DUF1610 family)